jgi:hypothetical protein
MGKSETLSDAACSTLLGDETDAEQHLYVQDVGTVVWQPEKYGRTG